MTISGPKSKLAASAANNLPDAIIRSSSVEATRPASLSASQSTGEFHRFCAGTSLSADHHSIDIHADDVGAQLKADQVSHAAQRDDAGLELLFCAGFLDDIEKLRIATENRLRSLEALGLNPTPYQAQAEKLAEIEHQVTLSLGRVMRKHPLGAWVKRTKGVGEKQGARLIASIGDVAHNNAEDRPRRGPAELWAYCGYKPGQKRRKGTQSNWNAEAKMRAFLVAESCMKQMSSPYRVVYDQARANWADRETSDGHKHNHALRCVAKAVLKDLFLEARKVGV